MDETSRLAEHYAQRKYVYDVVDLDLEEASSRCADEDIRLDGIVVLSKDAHPLHGSHLKTAKTHAKSDVPRYLETNRLGSALVYCLGSQVKGHLVPLCLVGPFLEFVPARLGRNAALDNAVSCLCAIYCGAPIAPYNLQKGIYQSYVRALSSLRSCLSDTSLWMDSETLCASILLQLGEVSLVYISSSSTETAANFCIAYSSSLSMSIEGNGVTLPVEPPFSSSLVACTDIIALSTTRC